MDSMRSLNTSLPRSSPRRRQNHPPADLLSAFKSAAQSVTLLYKTAADIDDSSRAAGYQDALDDLLAFLGQEDLGLGDGEGWRVRQWATERLSPSNDIATSPSEEKRARSSSPPAQQRHSQTSEVARAESLPPNPTSSQQNASSSQATSDLPPSQQEVFHFRSPIVLPPHDVEMDGSSDRNRTLQINTPQVRLNIPPRNTRKYSSQHLRGSLPGFTNASLGHGAGSKRKQNVPDFFDFDNFRDGNGGGKKSRNA